MPQSLEEARKYVQRNKEFGVECPCCEQMVRTKTYHMDSSIASGLLWLVQVSMRYKNGWVHVPSAAPTWVISARSYSKGRLWGLLERKPKSKLEKNKRTSGMWRPTQRGIDFVRNKITVPLCAYTYRGQVERFSEEHINIHKALGTAFSYEELLKRYRATRSVKVV